MRFHIGCSFSLRKLKKFIFPFIIGLLTYFLGSGLFGFTSVNALSYTNYDTTYNITYPELDLTTLYVDETHNLQEFFDELVDLGRDSTNYDLLIGINTYPNFSQLYRFIYSIILVPKGSLQTLGYNIFTGINKYSTPYFETMSNYNTISSYLGTYRAGLTSSSYSFGTDYTIDTNYLKIKSCLEDNSCELNFYSGGFSIQNIELKHNMSLFNNNGSYSIDLSNTSTYYTGGSPYTINGQVLYYSSFPIVFSNNSDYIDTRYNTFFKSIQLNGETYRPGDVVPTYCQLFDLCVESSPTLPIYNQIDDLFVSNIPTNSYTNLEVKFSLNYFNSNYSDSLTIQPLFYGRVDNSTYYSYEPIDCSLTGGTAYDDFTLNGTYHISSCSSSLTNYDSIILRLRMTSLDLISNFRYSTNLGHINTAPIYNGSNNVTIMDYFGALGPDFSVLVSSTQANSRLEFKGNDRYTFAQRINKATNDISVLSQTGVIYFGTNTNSNIMLYNYSLENNTNTDLYLFFSDDVIISFSDNGAYTYYDDSDTITTENITIKYLIDISQYDSSTIIDILDNFLTDLDSSMIDCHILFNSIYNGLPSLISFLILAIYSGFLLYLLYKLIKR